jgi:FimV-like protein
MPERLQQLGREKATLMAALRAAWAPAESDCHEAGTMRLPLPGGRLGGLALALLTLGLPGLTPGASAATSGEGAAAADAGQTHTTVANDNVWRLAGLALGSGNGDRAATMVAILRHNPQAFVQGNLHRLKRGVSLVLPTPAQIAAEDPRQAALVVSTHLALLGQNEAAPALPPLRPQAAPAPATGRGAAAPAVPATPPKVAAAPAPAPALATAPAPVPAPTPAPVIAKAPVAASVPTTAAPVASPAPAAKASAIATPSASAAAPAPAAPLAGTTLASAASSTAEANSGAPAASVLPRLPATAPEDVRGGRGLRHLLPYTLLGLLLALPAGWWWWRRRDPHKRLRAAAGDFRDSDAAGRGLKPRRVEISQAAVEVARTVETLRPSPLLVRPAQPTAGTPLDGATLGQQIALKLELARACLEVGRQLAAQGLLAVVQREGNEAERQTATELLASLGIQAPAAPAAAA